MGQDRVQRVIPQMGIIMVQIDIIRIRIIMTILMDFSKMDLKKGAMVTMSKMGIIITKHLLKQTRRKLKQFFQSMSSKLTVTENSNLRIFMKLSNKNRTVEFFAFKFLKGSFHKIES